MTHEPEAKDWRPKAKDFAEFQNAIEAALRSKPAGSEWMVGIEVKKVGNPVHDYRIVLSPGG